MFSSSKEKGGWKFEAGKDEKNHSSPLILGKSMLINLPGVCKPISNSAAIFTVHQRKEKQGNLKLAQYQGFVRNIRKRDFSLDGPQKIMHPKPCLPYPLNQSPLNSKSVINSI